MTKIRTFLVDDSPQFLDAAIHFLSSEPQIEVVGFSLSAQEALPKIADLSPDLVLMDLAMPGVSGLEATRQIKEQPDPPCVIILTLHDNTEYRLASEAVHADAFIPKSEFGVDLLPRVYSLFQEENVV